MVKKVVIGGYFHWLSYLHIGSHQYAKQFAQNGYEVAYISQPISPLHYVFAKDRAVLKEKHYSWFKGGERVEDGKIWAYVPFSFLPSYDKPILRSRWVIENSHRLTIPSIDRILKKNGFKQVDIVFLDEAFGYLLDLVVHRKSVLRIHDDISYLHNKGFENFLKQEKKVIQKVDLVTVVSRLLEKDVREMGAKKVFYLPNGVEFEHFYFGFDTLPEEYQNIPSPRIIYIGRIDYCFDVNLIAYAASNLPNVSFILIGKPMIDLSGLSWLSNVYILGKRNYNILPQYLKHADVGIMPLKRLPITEVIGNESKLFQYMACGLPVVSVKFKEFEYIDTLAHLAEGYEEFVELIKRALDEKDKSKYIEFAKANSWESRFEELIKVLYPNEVV